MPEHAEEPQFYALANCRRRLLVALRREMDQRPQHPTDWVERERLAITVAANEWATAHGLATITVDDVERIEGLAVGHVDYATKLALYVSELVHGVRNPQR